MTMLRELKPNEFTERLEPIFRSVESRLPKRLQGRKSEYFFPHWRRLMELGVARTWELPDAVIGLLITPDIFSGIPVAHVPFWFKTEGSKSPAKDLLKAAEDAAKKAGCVRFSIAAFCGLDFERMTFFYLKRGYKMMESSFQKDL